MQFYGVFTCGQLYSSEPPTKEPQMIGTKFAIRELCQEYLTSIQKEYPNIAFWIEQFM